MEIVSKEKNFFFTLHFIQVPIHSKVTYYVITLMLYLAS